MIFWVVFINLNQNLNYLVVSESLEYLYKSRYKTPLIWTNYYTLCIDLNNSKPTRTHLYLDKLTFSKKKKNICLVIHRKKI